MAGFGQYLKDTRSELRHVAWPTRTQTTVYTVLVAVLSIAIALYLGLFDFIFTSTLARALHVVPTTPSLTLTQTPATSTPESSPVTPAPESGNSPTFDIPKAQ